MIDAEFLVLMELRAIPQRNAHFMTLHGDKIAIAKALEARGIVVSQRFETTGETGFRLNKKGRDVLFGEWLRRGRPNAGETQGIK